jgi:glucose/arabinose dehydrogenase
LEQDVPQDCPASLGRVFAILTIALIAGCFGYVAPAVATTLPPGWNDTLIVAGMNAPVAFAFLPDGRILVAELFGNIRLVKDGVLQDPIRTIPVTTGGERGLLGLAVDPDFATTGHIYVYYTNTLASPKNQVSRLVMAGDGILPGETVLVQDIASDSGIHNAGGLQFGPDGRLYIGTGDGGAISANSQNLSNLSGKILRINKDGSIPADNPFVGQPGARGEIWVYGLRNPFRFSFDDDGRLFIGDVGSMFYDEVNVVEPGEPGSNFGWPLQEGPCAPPGVCDPADGSSIPQGIVRPVHWNFHQGHSDIAITGGVTSGPGAYPGAFDEAYFFADYGVGVIDVLRYDPASPTASVTRLGTNVSGIVQLARGPDGRVYYVSLFTGDIRRLDFDPAFGLQMSGGTTPPAAEPGMHVTVTATVTPAVGPPSTGIVVAADLSPIGGPSAQTLYDDGTNGDATAGDGVYSYRATVGSAAPLGAASLALHASDAQGRQAMATAQVTVQTVLDADNDLLPDHCETTFGLNANSAALHNAAAGDFDEDGLTNLEECRGRTHPRGFFVRRFAEGATSGFLTTKFGIANPHLAATARVLFRFQRQAGDVVTESLSIPPGGHATLDVATVPGMSNAEFATEVESDQDVTVERTMSWDRRGYGSHSQSSLPAAATRWYLAEGATHSNFDLFYLLQNPNDAAAHVQVTYLRVEGLPPLERTHTVPPQSRVTIWVNQEDPDLAAADVSARLEADLPVVVERAMYLGGTGTIWRAGHGGAGVTETRSSWYFAEGATGPFFDLYLLLMNPEPGDAQVQIEYLLPQGPPVVKHYVVAGLSRQTLWVEGEDERLADTAVSARVTVTNGAGIVAERAMWWPGGPPTWAEAHNSHGATRTATLWTIADGEIGGTRAAETFLLLANTSDRAGSAAVTVLVEGGARHTRTFPLGPSSRLNIAVGVEFPEVVNARFGAVIESLGDPPVDLVVERATYSSQENEPWAAGSNTIATPAVDADATIEITPDGLTPNHVDLPLGGRVRFVNRSTEEAQIASDPHPTHFFCRAMDPVRRLAPGQTAVSGPFRVAQDCSVHEHLNYDPRYHATISIR